MTKEMLQVVERIGRESRLWHQLISWGFKKSATFPAISDRQLLAGTDVTCIVHEALPDVGFTFQLNKECTHVVETSIPSFLYDKPGHYVGYKILEISDWLDFVNKTARKRTEIINEKLFKTAI